MQPFFDFELSDDEDADDTGATGEADAATPMTVAELAAALLDEEDDIEFAAAAPAPQAAPAASVARVAAVAPSSSAPAFPLRERRIAAPKSARGLPELEVDSRTLEMLSSMTLKYAMPTPREFKTEQGLVAAPLSHTPPEPSAPDKPPLAREKARRYDRATRKRRASERAMGGARGVTHCKGKKKGNWPEERYWKGRVFIHMVSDDGEATRGLTKHGAVNPIITRDQATLAEALLDKAAKQVAKISAVKKLPTGSAALWAMVCSLEAFARMNPGGYVVASERASFIRSWPGLEDTYEQLKRCEEKVPEDRCGLSMTHRFRPGYTGTAPLVRRSTGGHNFGKAAQKRKKIRCLDMLLREAGDKGLHYDIKKLRPPAIVEHDTPAHSLYAKHQTAAEKRWNAKSAARAAARKTAA